MGYDVRGDPDTIHPDRAADLKVPKDQTGTARKGYERHNHLTSYLLLASTKPPMIVRPLEEDQSI